MTANELVAEIFKCVGNPVEINNNTIDKAIEVISTCRQIQIPESAITDAKTKIAIMQARRKDVVLT